MTKDKIEQIVSDGTTVTVDDVEFKINPITTKEFMKAQVIGENKNQGEAIMHMVTCSLKEEEISKEDLEAAPPKLFMALQNGVEEVNDFEDFFDEGEKQEALEKLQ